MLILATDGLWDVLSNEEVAEAVTQFLPNCDPDDPHRFVHFDNGWIDPRASSHCGTEIIMLGVDMDGLGTAKGTMFLTRCTFTLK